MYKLPEIIANNLRDESNSDENIFVVWRYTKDNITNDDELEKLYLAIIKFKPNAKIVGQYAWELYEKNRIEVAISLIENKINYNGTDHDWECFKDSERDILPYSFENPFKVYQAKDDADLNVTINIYGRMHQLFQCTKEEDEDMYKYEIDDNFQNIFDSIFKIDDDNLINVEVDGETVFKGNISKLEIDSSNTEHGSDLSIPKRKYITPKLEKIKQIKDFHNFDEDEILVSKNNNLIVVSQGRLDDDKGLEIAPKFNNRYTIYNYGKYHIQTTIKLKSFSLSDLFFQMDLCMCDLIEEPSDGPFYSFSKIFHDKEGELVLKIINNNVKASYISKGWLFDC